MHVDSEDMEEIGMGGNIHFAEIKLCASRQLISGLQFLTRVCSPHIIFFYNFYLKNALVTSADILTTANLPELSVSDEHDYDLSIYPVENISSSIHPVFLAFICSTRAG